MTVGDILQMIPDQEEFERFVNTGKLRPALTQCGATCALHWLDTEVQQDPDLLDVDAIDMAYFINSLTDDIYYREGYSVGFVGQDNIVHIRGRMFISPEANRLCNFDASDRPRIRDQVDQWCHVNGTHWSHDDPLVQIWWTVKKYESPFHINPGEDGDYSGRLVSTGLSLVVVDDWHGGQYHLNPTTSNGFWVPAAWIRKHQEWDLINVIVPDQELTEMVIPTLMIPRNKRDSVYLQLQMTLAQSECPLGPRYEQFTETLRIALQDISIVAIRGVGDRLGNRSE